VAEGRSVICGNELIFGEVKTELEEERSEAIDLATWMVVVGLGELRGGFTCARRLAFGRTDPGGLGDCCLNFCCKSRLID
jgi:hypothetical protein